MVWFVLDMAKLPCVSSLRTGIGRHRRNTDNCWELADNCTFLLDILSIKMIFHGHCSGNVTQKNKFNSVQNMLRLTNKMVINIPKALFDRDPHRVIVA